MRSGLTPEQIANLTALSPEQIRQMGEPEWERPTGD
jgi:hypothetical protein